MSSSSLLRLFQDGSIEDMTDVLRDALERTACRQCPDITYLDVAILVQGPDGTYVHAHAFRVIDGIPDTLTNLSRLSEPLVGTRPESDDDIDRIKVVVAGDGYEISLETVEAMLLAMLTGQAEYLRQKEARELSVKTP